MIYNGTVQKTISSPEINAKIISLYLSKKDTYQVATECKCSQTFVMNTLKRYNIPRRSTQSYTTKYMANEKFFDNIDSEEKAYVLGFYYADGNNYINDNNYQVSIGLQEGDKIILEKFRDLLSPQSELKFTNYNSYNANRKNQYSLKINSKVLSQQLTKLGCVPNKSLILTWPQWLVDDKLRQHFIRGYFDGDGSLYAKKPSKTGHIDWGLTIVSTENFTDFIRKYLKDILKIHCTKKKYNKGPNQITTTLSIGGNLQMEKVLDWMYQDATIYLPRKYEKYQDFKKQVYLNHI